MRNEYIDNLKNIDQDETKSPVDEFEELTGREEVQKESLETMVTHEVPESPAPEVKKEPTEQLK